MSPVDPKPATREPGTALSASRSTWSSCWRMSGEFTVSPSASCTTGTSGRLSPPLPYTRRISWLVSQPSRPGTLKRWSSASLAGPAATMPTSVATSHPIATSRLCRRTRRVSRCIMKRTASGASGC